MPWCFMLAVHAPVADAHDARGHASTRTRASTTGAWSETRTDMFWYVSVQFCGANEERYKQIQTDTNACKQAK